MSGVLGAIGMAGLDVATDTVSNWLQGKMDLNNSRKLMRFQTDQQLKAQSVLNQRLYPQTIASMRMAGLNPAMINGPLGATSASMPSATQNKQAARMDAVGAASAVSQLKLLDSQINVNNAQANALNADALVKREDRDYKSFLNDTAWENYAYEKAEQVSRTSKNYADRDVALQNFKNLGKQFDILAAELDNARKDGKRIDEVIKTIVPIANAQIAQYMSQAKVNKAHLDEIKWNAEKLAADASVSSMEVALKKELTRMTRVQADIIQKYGARSEEAKIAGMYVKMITDVINSGANMLDAATPF